MCLGAHETGLFLAISRGNCSIMMIGRFYVGMVLFSYFSFDMLLPYVVLNCLRKRWKLCNRANYM